MCEEKVYEFQTWQEVLDAQEEWLEEQINFLKDIGNVEDYFPNHQAILDQIDRITDNYTEFEEVGEEFHYSASEWRHEIEKKFTPIIQRWFEEFCEQAKNSELDYSSYIANFWGESNTSDDKVFAKWYWGNEQFKKDDIICPWCETEFSEYKEKLSVIDAPLEVQEKTVVTCPKCGKRFELEIETKVVYTTRKYGGFNA